MTTARGEARIVDLASGATVHVITGEGVESGLSGGAEVVNLPGVAFMYGSARFDSVERRAPRRR